MLALQNRSQVLSSEVTESVLKMYADLGVDTYLAHERKHNVTRFINHVDSTDLKASLCRFFSDANVYVESGGQLHHYEVGGLIDHLLETARYSLYMYNTMSKLKKFINKDILVYCALLHDIGKLSIDEFKDESPYSIYHAYAGKMRVNNDLARFSKQLTDNDIEYISDVIYTHHVDVEPGEDEPHRTSVESFIIHLADQASTTDDRMSRCFSGTLNNAKDFEKEMVPLIHIV